MTGNSVPGREIIKVIGPVIGFSAVSSDTTGKFQLAEREAMLSLLTKAREEGADAVIDLKMMTISFEQSGMEGATPKVTYVGTAVVL